jgi:hypothetical protein
MIEAASILRKLNEVVRLFGAADDNLDIKNKSPIAGAFEYYP